MASYLILTPPDATDRDFEKARFIRDSVCFTAFLFPVLWLLSKHLWFFAVAAFLVQAIAVKLIGMSGLAPAGIAILLAVHLYASLEGRHLLLSDLTAKGWDTDALIVAPNLGTAEEIYFAGMDNEITQDIPKATRDISGASRRAGSALGLLGYNGGR